MKCISPSRTACRAVAVFVLLAGPIGPAPAQSPQTLTWTGGGGNNNWFTTTNWNPNGTPGAAGSTGNLDRALFDTSGSSISATVVSGGFNLGAIATTGASGGSVTVNFDVNGGVRLNGGYTVGSFTNVAAAAQNGRNLTITTASQPFSFGSGSNATTFYADAGRTLAIGAQQINNQGGALNKEGAGTLLMGTAAVAPTLELGGTPININGGTLGATGSLNNTTQISVASGAALQAGLAAGGTLSTNATVNFATNSSLRIVTDGSTVSQLQNATLVKGAADTFRIVLTGLNPTGTQTFNPGGTIFQGSPLQGFGANPNGTFTQSSPGQFAVSGDGFAVTAWSVTVLNNNQIQLNSLTVAPVPEPGLGLAVALIGLATAGLLRRARRADAAVMPG